MSEEVKKCKKHNIPYTKEFGCFKCNLEKFNKLIKLVGEIVEVNYEFNGGFLTNHGRLVKKHDYPTATSETKFQIIKNNDWENCCEFRVKDVTSIQQNNPIIQIEGR
jgi:hypothetical protein